MQYLKGSQDLVSKLMEGQSKERSLHLQET